MTDETDQAQETDQTPQAVAVEPAAETPRETAEVGGAVERMDLADAQAQEAQNAREQAELSGPPPSPMEAVTPQAEPLSQQPPAAVPVAPPAETEPTVPAPSAPQGEFWVCTTEDGSARTTTAKGMCPAFLVDLSAFPPGMLIGCPTCGGTRVRQALPEETPAGVS